MSKTWDCFPFFNELDLLECRLSELDPVVDRFVLVEAAVTHQGQPKPLYYAENKDRFAPWQGKIIHVVADLDVDGSAPQDNWRRENAQREAITRGLGDMAADDIFLLSDMDEIPFPDVIGRAPGHVLAMRNHIMAVDLLDPGWWAGTVARWGRNVPGRIQELRDNRHFVAANPPLKDKWGLSAVTAGWHFSWLGGPGAMRAKAAAFAHAEETGQVDADAEHMWAEKKIFAGTERQLIQCVIDETWPEFMRERRGPASWYWGGT